MLKKLIIGISRFQRGSSIRWSSGSVLAAARSVRPMTRRWISLFASVPQ